MLDFIKEKKDCTACGACVNICPKNCISLEKDADGFLFPVKNDEMCNNCGLCEKICPINSNQVKKDKAYEKQKYFAFCVDDESVWQKSTSGGAYSAICNAIIEEYGKGNVLFAGVVIEDLRVKHILSSDYSKFHKSKYVQSDMHDIYMQMDKELKNDKVVVFTGTPCQVAGVNSYFKLKKKKPILIDFVCHGVGSHEIFTEYLDSLNKKNNNVTNYSFREKQIKNGNLLDYCSTISYQNGRIRLVDRDVYVQAFLNQLTNRESCQDNCMFRHKERLSDFTIGDFRNVHYLICDTKYRNRNYSMIVVNSDFANNLIHRIKMCGDCLECNLDNIIQVNPLFDGQEKNNQNRYDFHEYRKKYGTKKALNKYRTLRFSLKRKIALGLSPKFKRVIKKILHKK